MSANIFRNADHAMAQLAGALSVSPEEPSRVGTVRRLPCPVMFAVRADSEPLALHPARRLNPWVTLCEFPWMVAARNDVAYLSRWMQRASAFSDDGVTWRGAYGPRLRATLPFLLQHLGRHPATRRAYASLFQPEDTVALDTKDVPCTVGLAFATGAAPDHRVESDTLSLTSFMRSNDLLWGLTGANLPNWILLLRLAAECLRLRAGWYFHVANNLHVYSERVPARRLALLQRRVPTHDWEPWPRMLRDDLDANPAPLYLAFRTECRRALAALEKEEPAPEHGSPYLEAWGRFMRLSPDKPDLPALEATRAPHSWKVAACLWWARQNARKLDEWLNTFLYAYPATVRNFVLAREEATW